MIKNKTQIRDARFERMVGEIEDYAIILLDEEGNIENWNQGAEKIKGYTAEEALGKNFRMFYTEEAKAEGRPCRLLKLAAEVGKARDEGWRVRKDGSRFWGSILITAIHDEDGQVIGFTKVTRDLTAQKITEENLRKSEERYHRMVSEVEDYAIILLDEQGHIENWNKGAEHIKGYKAEEIIGKSFRTFYTAEDKKNKLPESLLKRARETGRANHEGWRIRKDGTLFWGNTTITALHDAQGKVIGFSKVTRDLTDRKRLDAMMKIEARNQELEQFAYVASHDLQEPLRTISSFVDLLKEEYGEVLDGEGGEFLSFIQQSVTRMDNIITDLLDYSRLGHQKERTEVNCQRLVQEIIFDLSASIMACDGIIDIPEPLPTVEGYPVEIRQLFQNLLSNALKFRRPGVAPRISITCEEVPGSWLFAVEDNGIGIEEKYFDKIFLLFQRLHSREEYDGTGIGLAHCKKIVEMHDGVLWLESTPGQGTTFWFTLSR